MTITGSGVVLSRCDPARPREVRRFLAAAHHVHEHCFPESRWVAPLTSEVRHYLDPAKNPLFGHATVALWVASLRGRVVGSIAAVDDADWRLHQRRDGGSFGFFECVDSPALAAELLGAAADWLRGRGLRHMIGPFNLTTNYTTGFLADTFGSEPTFMMPYNPPYYLDLMEACGLRKAKELWEWSVPLDGGGAPATGPPHSAARPDDGRAGP